MKKAKISSIFEGKMNLEKKKSVQKRGLLWYLAVGLGKQQTNAAIACVSKAQTLNKCVS